MSIIRKWKTFCHKNNYPPCPAQVYHLSKFISSLSINHEPLSTFQKLSPALVFFHDANHITSPLAVRDPFVKLVLEGAKREAAKSKQKVRKPSYLSQDQIHDIIDRTIWKNWVGQIGQAPDLSMWRTVTRIYTMFMCFCRWDCYQELTTQDVTFHEDHVCLQFTRAKNDQFFAGS